jgi:aspartyl-tRNA(Asn)/glutamyl-tRNA(Gln) amidotransferase subunit B
MVSNWIMSEALREIKDYDREMEDCPVIHSVLTELLKMIKNNTISGKIGEDVFKKKYLTGKSPKAILKDKGLAQNKSQYTLCLTENPTFSVKNPKYEARNPKQ